MDHVRQQVSDIVYGPFHYENHLYLSETQRENLEEVKVSLFGSPSQIQYSRNFTAPSDVRLYIDQQDVTPSFIYVLKQLIDNADQATIKSQYKGGLDALIALEVVMGEAGFGRPAGEVSDAAIALLAVEPLSALVDQLGNSQVLAYGMPHIFNYLWSHIDLPYVSLFDTVNHHNSQPGSTAIDLLQARRLTVSNGPCRLFSSGAWQIPRTFGTVRLQVDAIYHNTLVDRVDELEKRFDEFEEWVNEDLATILEALDRDGPISRQVRQAAKRLEDGKLAIAQAEGAVKNHGAQIQALTGTAQDLKSSVDAL